jgi:hypothetical protein
MANSGFLGVRPIRLSSDLHTPGLVGIRGVRANEDNRGDWRKMDVSTVRCIGIGR